MVDKINELESFANRLRHVELELKRVKNPPKIYRPTSSDKNDRLISIMENRIKKLELSFARMKVQPKGYTPIANADLRNAKTSSLKTSEASLDSSDVTYTPEVDADWDGDADPGDLDDALDQLAERVDDNETAIDDLITFVPCSTPLTSTSFDGDSFSTVSTKTALDLESNFGLPSGAVAIVMEIIVKDSGSQAGNENLNLSFWLGTGDAHQIYSQKLLNVANDTQVTNIVTMPLNASGDLYYTVYASGTDTMDIILEILGYWI